MSFRGEYDVATRKTAAPTVATPKKAPRRERVVKFRPTRRDAYVGVRLPPELLARIRAAADADDVTVSDVVRRVLRAALAADVDARVP